MKIQRIISVIAIAFALLFNQFGSASAKSNVVAASNSCQVNIAAKSGVAPFKTTIEITGINGPTMVIFGDNTPEKIGRLQVHTFHPVGKFRVTAIVNGTDGFPYRCHGYVTSLPNGEMEIPTVEFENDDNTITVDLKVDSNSVPLVDNSEINMGENAGANSFGVVNTGEGDVHVTIERDPQPLQTPIPAPVIVAPDVICSDNLNNSGTIVCATPGSNVTINPIAPKMVQKTNNWFDHVIHAALKAGMIFFQTLDEGAYQPVPVQ